MPGVSLRVSCAVPSGWSTHEFCYRADFLREQREVHRAQEHRKSDTHEVLQVGKVSASKRQIEGLVEIGQYGSESTIRNLDRWKEVAYRKLVRDVDLRPFYFLFDIPEGKNLGYVDIGIWSDCALLRKESLRNTEYTDHICPYFESSISNPMWPYCGTISVVGCLRLRDAEIAEQAVRDENVITVLIVDDHPVVREGLRAVLSLEADMQVVVEIGTGEDALAVIPEFRSAVVLMDLLLPDISGVEVIRRICATSADIAFLVLSTHIRKYDDVLFASIR